MSIKSLILSFLENKDWSHLGPICEYVKSVDSTRWNTVDRRCRELQNEGKLYRKLVQIEGKGAFVVMYKRVEIPLAPLNPVSVDQMRLI